MSEKPRMVPYKNSLQKTKELLNDDVLDVDNFKKEVRKKVK